MHEIHLGCEYINAGRGTWAPNEKSSGTGLGLEAHARNSRPLIWDSLPLAKRA
ncbi:MAG TPA: hypothetical protein VHA33_06175 [Candidatus Angelobacter sp.]|nr:hypothetical protein [Candidatus Angelobacter sp.]